MWRLSNLYKPSSNNPQFTFGVTRKNLNLTEIEGSGMGVSSSMFDKVQKSHYWVSNF